MENNLNNLSSEELAGRCENESSKKIRESRDDQYCYELVRRAFENEDVDALNSVWDIYEKIWSKYWIKNPNTFDSQATTADDFRSEAFWKVYFKFKGNGIFHQSFPSINAFQSYLRITLVRLIALYFRKNSKVIQLIVRLNEIEGKDDLIDLIPSNENISEDFEKKIKWEEIEKRTYALFPDKNDRLLFDLVYKEYLTNQKIAQTYPLIWPTADDVRKRKYRINQRLLRDPTLINLLKSWGHFGNE